MPPGTGLLRLDQLLGVRISGLFSVDSGVRARAGEAGGGVRRLSMDGSEGASLL